jgi:type III secretion system YscI/HrpB-like protein
MMSGDVGQVSQSAGMHTSSITNSSALDGIEKFSLNSDLNSDTRIPPATMGDGILTSMQNLSDNFKKVHEDVVRSLDNSGDMKLTDMLKLQINMSEMSFQWDAFSKVVTKSTQNLEQLLKLQ